MVEEFFNMFELKEFVNITRRFYYCQGTDPYIFAKNLSRVNNIRFTYSNDIVWCETLDGKTELEPDDLSKYLVNKVENIKIEEDEKLFEKVFYSEIKKLFIDNGFYYKARNKFLSKEDSFLLKSNKNVRAYRSYEVKLEKIDKKYYMSILPGFTLFSKNSIDKSEIESLWSVNLISGRSFFTYKKENDFFIDIKGVGSRKIRYPENYYYNFNSEDANRHGFSKDSYNLSKQGFYEEINSFPEKLKFLEKFIKFSSIIDTSECKKNFNIKYTFDRGESYNFKDIFKYTEKIDEKVNLLFFFESEDSFEKNSNAFRTVFSNKRSMFYKSINDLGIEEIEFIKNGENGKSLFFYNKDSLSIDKKTTDFLNGLNKDENYAAIIVLDKYLGDIEPLIKNFPKHIILQPILKENLLGNKSYILSSYAFKVASFIKNRSLYGVKGLDKFSGDLFIGLDVNHDFDGGISNFAISAINYHGEIIYIKKYNQLELNEKVDIDILEVEIIKAINVFKEKYGETIKNLFLYRDGRFIEKKDQLENIIVNLGIIPIFIEVNKNSKIMTSKEEKEKLYILDDRKAVFYPKNFLKQKGVEINIVLNRSEYSYREIINQVIDFSYIYHGSPYSNLKLPYPIHIADKIARTEYEWRLYIPHLK